ncbi:MULTISPECIES: zinc ribbon domain-containing protein [Mycobacterium]|uniref:Cas12f1-like TNB domain-containing protein n=1 Tax=Mycobacterium paraffinicum TaxID=53378 RepID=A0A1Q4HP42_9MYCO|nr:MULTISPECIES: zinc ribbon domain-containing protein [Mycobacterium]OCB20033.1 hypothetical protein A5689_21190 [Mycobacterium intracellulare subsp. yongonense]OJZ69458.1 hypothetical protein BRW65_22900 [Mycobacterium paraffinicum]
MKVTRIAYSRDLNNGKYKQLVQQAKLLGRVRSLVWQQYGSVSGVGVRDREIRDTWMADGTAASFGVLANSWKETLRDAVGDIRARRESSKVKVRSAVYKHCLDPGERRRYYTLLKADQWAEDTYLSRLMRQHYTRGRNHTHNQIVVRADQYRTFTRTDGGNVWLAVPGLVRRQMVRIPLDTTVAPTGTLRIILRNNRVEVHYQIDSGSMRSSLRPSGDRVIGVDKGYTEAFTDADGDHHGDGLGERLAAESDHRRIKNERRAKIRAIAEKAFAAGDLAKSARIVNNNLGLTKRTRRNERFEVTMRSLVFSAAHAVVNKAREVVAEDLTRPIPKQKKRGKTINRRLSAWIKGVEAEALANVSERRGSALTLVNAAYTSQVAPCCDVLAHRHGDRLHCTRCGVVWQADHAAAINIERRKSDPDIGLYTPHLRVKQILLERDRRRLSTAEPGLQPSQRRRANNHPFDGHQRTNSDQGIGSRIR